MINKTNAIKNCQEGHVRAERDFLVAAAETSRWVISLMASFQDDNHLYLVMEYAPGGDFLGLLLSNPVLPEPSARFYLAEMIMGVEEMHRMGWIHRDIKPDNFLVTASGHLKISDFGLAFDGKYPHNQSFYLDQRFALYDMFGVGIEGDDEDRANPRSFRLKGQARYQSLKLARSLVGTSQYMAPELVRHEPYDARCDWWSIGVILYECLYARTPFVGENRAATIDAITNHLTSFVLPLQPTYSLEVRSLICRLITDAPNRICCPEYRANNDFAWNGAPYSPADKASQRWTGQHTYADDAVEIKRHPFFAHIPWDHLHQIPPPFCPDITGDLAKYFDTEDEIIRAMNSEQRSGMLVNVRASKEDGQNGIGRMDGVFTQQKTVNYKQRPKDKILRDAKIGETAMTVRRNSAFLGYTYRRPRKWSAGIISSGLTMHDAWVDLGDEYDTDGDFIMSD